MEFVREFSWTSAQARAYSASAQHMRVQASAADEQNCFSPRKNSSAGKAELFLRLYTYRNARCKHAHAHTDSLYMPPRHTLAIIHSLPPLPPPPSHDPNRDNTADALHVLVRQLRYVAKPIHSLGHLSKMSEWVSVCECSEPHTQRAR